MFSSCRRYAARGLALVTFVVLTAMNSCEGRNTAPAVPFTGKQLPGALLAMLPPLPQGRQASYTEDRVRLGAQTYDRSANTDVSGTSLRFSAGAGSLEWAIWSLDAAACTPVNLDIHLSATAGECVYLAVANYAAGRWEIYGPVEDDTEHPLSGAAYKNAMESVYCAMLAYDGASPRCYSVTLTVDTGDNISPRAELLARPESGMVPLTVDYDATGSFDADGAITDYQWDLDEDGVFSETGEEQDARGSEHATRQYADPGDYMASVRVTDDGGLTNLASQGVVALEPNQPPVCVLQANPESGTTPLEGGVIGMDSYDPDGTIGFVWDFDGDGLFSEAGEEEYCDNYSNVAFNYTSAGVYTISAKITDNDGASDIESVQITVTGNAAPTAELQADVTSGDAPLTVSFDASGSADADGTVADFEWDLDGDLAFNEAGSELNARGLNSAQYTYDAPGAYAATVRVTDNAGGTGNAQQVIATHGWVVVTIDDSFDLTGNSLALINGRPAISYIDREDGCLKYAYSTTPLGAGSSDWQLVSLPGYTNGEATSLAGVDGCPAIAFESGVFHDLVYTRSTTASGSSAGDWQAVLVDNLGATGYRPAMKVVDGRPAISYSDHGASALMYALSSTATGMNTADWSCIAVATGTGDEVWDSLAVINGKPAIAFFTGTSAALQYAFSSTVSGSAPADWSCIVLDNTLDSAGRWCSLAQVAGKPAISYQGTDDYCDVLRYAVSSTAQGTDPASWTKLTIDDESQFCGPYTSLAEVGGKPAIAYQDSGPGILKFAASSTASGGNPADWSRGIADGAQYCGEMAVLAVINGYPAVSYTKYADMYEEVRYAILMQ